MGKSNVKLVDRETRKRKKIETGIKNNFTETNKPSNIYFDSVKPNKLNKNKRNKKIQEVSSGDSGRYVDESLTDDVSTKSPWERLPYLGDPLPNSFMENLYSSFSVKNKANNEAHIPQIKVK